MENYYEQIPEERFQLIMGRYAKFQQNLDLGCEPVKVFDPIPEHLLRELDLIREASRGLQAKKEEDVSKAAQAAEQAALEAEKKAAEEAEQEKEVEKEDS